MKLSFSNKGIAQMLRRVASAYEILNEDRFRVIAYNRAADSIEHLGGETKDLWDDGKLDEIPSVGKNLASYLDEYFKTGKVRHFREVTDKIPPAVFLLLDVPGLGPKSAFKLVKGLKIKDLSGLKRACEKGLVADLPGFGEKSQNEIIMAIKEYERRSNRILLPEAYNIACKIITKLQGLPGVVRVDALGSLRRMVSTVGDIDLAAAARDPANVIERFTALPEVRKVLVKGPVKASVLLEGGQQVDLRVQKPQSYGAQLQYFTGSKNHNIHLRRTANEMGYSLSEYGIKSVKESESQRIKEFATEEAFYEYLGMDWIPPEMREDTGEIEAAMKHKLPELVELADIKGDLHLHGPASFRTSHDSGVSPVEDIIKKASSLGYEYICLGDHSPSISYYSESEVIDVIERKKRIIEQINSSDEKSRGINILNSFEIDILADNKLSIPDEGLKMIDLVVASVHSSMRQSRARMTERLLTAIRNPYVHIIGHPTGRLLLERESYELDWEIIFEECRKFGKILEVNAHPSRLDLPDDLVKEAVGRGVRLAINTDAHNAEDLELMRFGVATARRGWAKKADVVNTLPWEKFRRLL